MDKARQVYTSLVLIAATVIASGAAPGDQLAGAIEYIRHAEWRKADAVLEQCPPADPSVLYWKAYVRFRTGRYAEAVSLASRYLETKPESAAAHKILGLCYFMQEHHAEAERELKRATDLDSSDTEALYYLGRLHFTRNDAPEALRIFERLVLLDKNSVRGYNHLGQTYEALTRFDDARAAYRKAIELDRTQPARSQWPYFNLGVLYLKEGRPEEAIGLIRQALVINSDWPEGKTQLAIALSSADQFDEARLLLKEVLQNNPTNADAHYQMGRLLLKLGKPEEARPHLQEFESLKKQR